MHEARRISSDMHGVERLLLEQFVEKDYGDDLLLLTATEEKSGQLVGMIFWRYLRRCDDHYWEQVNIDWSATGGGQTLATRGLNCDRWTLIELLCTDRKYRGHGVGKLLLVTALAYSAVKDGRTAAVLTLGGGEGHENEAARALYEKVGFEEMPEQAFLPKSKSNSPSSSSTVDPSHVLVVWNITRSLRSLTLGDVSGIRKGTRVPLLEAVAQAPAAANSRATSARRAAGPLAAGSEEPGGGGEDGMLRRLDSGACVDVVRQLTGA